MPSIGWQELVIVLVIVLVIFGPKRLPEIGRSLGKGIREFKKSTSELQEKLTEEESTPAIDKAQMAEKPADKLEPQRSEAKSS